MTMIAAMSQYIPELKLLLPIDGGEQEIIVSSEFVKNVILPGIEHEVGHIVAAAHFGAYLVGIGVGFIQISESVRAC